MVEDFFDIPNHAKAQLTINVLIDKDSHASSGDIPQYYICIRNLGMKFPCSGIDAPNHNNCR